MHAPTCELRTHPCSPRCPDARLIAAAAAQLPGVRRHAPRAEQLRHAAGQPEEGHGEGKGPGMRGAAALSLGAASWRGDEA